MHAPPDIFGFFRALRQRILVQSETNIMIELLNTDKAVAVQFFCFSFTSLTKILQKKHNVKYTSLILGKGPLKNTNQTAKIHCKPGKMKQFQSFQADDI